VVTAALADIFGQIDEDDYLKNTSTVVAVIDVHDTYPGRADGSARLPQSGLPTITQAPTGHHGFSFPNAPIPEDLRVSVLKMGEGEPIMQGDFVTTHFTGVVWNTRQVFISSFDQGVPLGLIADDQTTSATGEGVIPGLAQALVGKTVGSQVLVSVPPQLGYQPENLPPGVGENQTVVFVFDILGVSN
jgi:peptidylprolyl isomerase